MDEWLIDVKIELKKLKKERVQCVGPREVIAHRMVTINEAEDERRTNKYKELKREDKAVDNGDVNA